MRTTVLIFLGMDDIRFVYAESLAMGAESEQSAIGQAHEEIEETLGA